MKHTLLSLLLVAGAGVAQGQLLYNNAAQYGLTQEGLRTKTRPAGGDYSEVQAGNMICGYRGSVTNGANDRLADDFTVSGSNWSVKGLSLFMYQTDANAVTINGGLFEIHKKMFNGSVGNVIASGTFASASFTNIYRIFNNQPDDSRHLQRVDVNFNALLSPGSYYLVWATRGAWQYQGPWQPYLDKAGSQTLAGSNALQSFDGGTTWSYILDGTQRQDFPFWLYGTRNYDGNGGGIAPEPTSLLALGAGVLALLRRKK